MQVADRHRERVGGVVRRGRFRQTEQQLDHLLHLMFFRPAVADHGPLDLGRVYSTTSQPASTAARIATPRAWPSFSALRAFTA
jgi:hypothetical protein